MATDENFHAALDASLQEYQLAMVGANRSGDIKVSALNRCFARLKNNQVYPTCCMKVGGVMKNVDDTHEVWCGMLRGQSGDLSDLEPSLVTSNVGMARQLTARAKAARGAGTFDAKVTQCETDGIIRSWDDSPSVPADLIPRAAYQTGDWHWHRVA